MNKKECDTVAALLQLLSSAKDQSSRTLVCNCPCNCNYPPKKATNPVNNPPLTSPAPQFPSTSVPWVADVSREALKPTSTQSSNPPPPPPPPPPPVPTNTFPLTPSISKAPNVGAPCMDDATQFVLTRGGNTGHDPDGVGWLTPAQWQAASWNGVPINICGMTFTQMKEALFPDINTMRGLRELFYATNPFADNRNPTVPEIDNWNIKVIQHLRNLVGATQSVSGSKCLFLEAQWAAERQNSTVWDTQYPSTADPVFGPCVGQTNAHCGATFVPNAADQAPYITGYCRTIAQSEGIFTVNKDLPWCIKLSRVIAGTIWAEGTTGHAGPFFGREFVGLSFTCAGTGMIVRGKWSGNLVPLC